ncbi:hypothetical protein BASA81_013542 [Batrachochytrium salamandrivorans]|nr:hypothetical protein BASA81_013542 [Batrachochytrium salamandrivorans]
MSDAKYFQRGKVHELRDELASDKKDTKSSRRRHALKKVVANMTMGNDMTALFPDVLACMTMPQLEVKKMDTRDENPLIRALALRTMGSIAVAAIAETLCEPLHRLLADKDPYVCKTAVLCVAKIFAFHEEIARREGFVELVKGLLNHGNPSVVANAVAALTEITFRAPDIEFKLSISHANTITSAIEECNEWGQVYILESIMTVVPDDANDASLLADRISPRLQHSNSAVVITAVRVMLYLSNYFDNDAAISGIFKKLGPPLVTLLHCNPEIQYVALRNILLILQRQPDFLKNDLKVFFCKYDDPIYVKLTKLEILFRLSNASNINMVLPELKEYAVEVDIDFVRKAVRLIGRCAIKIEESPDKCIEVLIELITTKVNYVVQEAVVVIKDIFRKYPNRYESILGILCENLDNLDESEAKASMIWIIGQYSDRIENADELLEQFLDTFKEDSSIVQLSLLTAIVKLFIKRPGVGVDLVPRVLKCVTEDIDNPDLRDRGFIYWRLLSTDPVAAKAIILSEKPCISIESDNMDGPLLNQLLYNVSMLSSLTHQPPILAPNVISKVAGFTWYTALQNKLPNASKSASVIPPHREPVNEYTNGNVIEQRLIPGLDNNLLDLSDFDNDDNGIASVSPPGYLPATAQPSLANHFGTAGGVNMSFPGYAMAPTAASVNSSHNPFALSAVGPSTTGGMGGGMGPTQGSASGGTSDLFGLTGSAPVSGYGANILQPLQGTSPAKLLLDPFSKTSAATTATRMDTSRPVLGNGAISLMEPNPPLQSVPLADSHIDRVAGDLLSLNLQTNQTALKSTFLSAQAGRGLEIKGCFSKKGASMMCEMTFTNKALQTLTDFAIIFNKNSFGLTPAQPLDIRNPLLPDQSVEVNLQLKIEGLPVLSTPVNNLQVAVKSTAGIVYFQTLVPLYLFFSDQGAQIPPPMWIKLWKEDIPNQAQFTLSLGRVGSVSHIRSRLQERNIFTINERASDGNTFLYLSAKMEDGAIFLVEMRLDASLVVCACTAKTYATHLFSPFQAACQDILC